VDLKYHVLEYLKKSSVPWIKYNLGFCDADEVLMDERIQQLIAEAKCKDDIVLKRHNDAKHPMHKTALLADLGLTKEHRDIAIIAENIMKHQNEFGAFLSMQNIPSNFGGTGRDEYEWVLCDFPTYLYSLIKFGYKDDERVIKAVGFLKSMAQDNGFGCASSIPKFNGPGKRSDHCPYSNLIALKVFSLMPEYHSEEFIIKAINELLNMWRTQGKRKYRMFGIGTDFRKLKFPNIWFTIVHVLTGLSYYEYARKSPEFREMLEVIANKQTGLGGFIPESIYMNFKPFDFGQKKVESDTLTYQIYTIFNRLLDCTLNE